MRTVLSVLALALLAGCVSGPPVVLQFEETGVQIGEVADFSVRSDGVHGVAHGNVSAAAEVWGKSSELGLWTWPLSAGKRIVWDKKGKTFEIQELSDPIPGPIFGDLFKSYEKVVDPQTGMVRVPHLGITLTPGLP